MDRASADSIPGSSESLHYHPDFGVLDEAICPDGRVNRAWKEWMGILREDSGSIFQNWERATMRFVHEFGATYAADPGDEKSNRRWRLDPVPWILSEQEWEKIERGIRQRVELATAIFEDLHGQGRLLKEKVIPQEVVLRHRGFLRSFSESHLRAQKWPTVGLSAFDLARGPKGQMWVINQRFDSPLGLGFVLENRSIVGRVVPSAFQACQVRRLADFFRSWRQELEGLSWPSLREQRAVIMTSETGECDFESSFLANYLGYTRVRPADLTVRDRMVWLRSLGGLERVHVIWRMSPGRTLDPLECNSADAMGIPGLFDAMRAGNVSVFNHPATGVLESPGWFPFLPAVCQKLLNDDLILPTVATWWCGQESALKYVIENLSRMVVKSVNTGPDSPTIYGSSLTREQLEELRARILADPEMFTGQEEVHFSTVPSLVNGGLEPRPAVLRSFAMRNRQGQVRVLSGGLARSSNWKQSIVSTHSGGLSKDVWIRSESRQPVHKSLWQSEAIPAEELNPVHVPSRTGENLFWTGRYAERADVTARCLQRLLVSRIEGFDQPADIERHHEQYLLETLMKLAGIPKLGVGKNLNVEAELVSFLEDGSRSGSLPAVLEAFRFAAHEVRDVWSGMSLGAIEACIDGWVEAKRNATSVFDYYGPLDRLMLDLSAFLGLNLESMTRDAGWCLLDAGRRIERADHLTSIIEDGLAKPLAQDFETLIYESVLTISDSLVTFRRRYRRELRAHRMLDLMLKVDNNPRSLAYQLSRLRLILDDLPGKAAWKTPKARILNLVDKAKNELDQACPKKLIENKESDGRRLELVMFLKRIRKVLHELSDEMTVSYFTHTIRKR